MTQWLTGFYWLVVSPVRDFAEGVCGLRAADFLTLPI